MKDTGYCFIRIDLIEEDLAVPIGKAWVMTKKLLQYRWKTEDVFEIKVNLPGSRKQWHKAESIDFDFPYPGIPKPKSVDIATTLSADEVFTL